MTLAVVWLPAAMNAYRSLRVTDPEGARHIARRIAALAAEPRPEGSNSLGETDFRRLRLDQYRVLYEVTPDTVRRVMHVGRALPARPA
jgi:mRNA-degrading endonuclease RelE of RelBE toxin-antitoxin system